jgi:hypothetical protein
MAIGMTRCPKCNKENYALNVISGICTWCGYQATEEDVDGVKVWKHEEEDEECA